MLVAGDEVYPIDYANACPDVAVTSLHYYFPWAITALVRWSTYCLVTGRRQSVDLRTRDYYAIADDESLSYDAKITAYSALADEHFETDRYRQWCDEMLPHLPEQVHDYVSGPDFDAMLRRTVEATYPAHEHERFLAHFRGLVGMWRRSTPPPEPHRTPTLATIAAMARGTRWGLGVLVVLLVAVGGVWAFGGFRETTHTLPEAAVGEAVDLGRYAITVDSARYVDRDGSGEPLEEDGRPAVALVVRIHARMLDREAGDLLSGTQPAVRVRNGARPGTPSRAPRRTRRTSSSSPGSTSSRTSGSTCPRSRRATSPTGSTSSSASSPSAGPTSSTAGPRGRASPSPPSRSPASRSPTADLAMTPAWPRRLSWAATLAVLLVCSCSSPRTPAPRPPPAPASCPPTRCPPTPTWASRCTCGSGRSR